jgi:hypothetical protein
VQLVWLLVHKHLNVFFHTRVFTQHAFPVIAIIVTAISVGIIVATIVATAIIDGVLLFLLLLFFLLLFLFLSVSRRVACFSMLVLSFLFTSGLLFPSSLCAINMCSFLLAYRCVCLVRTPVVLSLSLSLFLWLSWCS